MPLSAGLFWVNTCGIVDFLYAWVVGPRHVLLIFSLLLVVGCASNELLVPTTTSAPTTTGAPTTTNAPTTSSAPATTSPPTTNPPTATTSPTTTSLPASPVAETPTDDDNGSASATVQVTDQAESPVAILLSRLEALAVQAERRAGYDRDLFDHWVDADGDRCDARREVLIAEAIVRPRVGSRCSLSGGEWHSVYDGVIETGNGSRLDVDHLVPLAEAWDSGAYGWDNDTRRRYANDLGYAHSLVAVSRSSNRQKGADDPAEWLPPAVSVRCWYAEAWIAVKTRWELSVDTAELQALRRLVSGCDTYELGSAPVAAVPISTATATTDTADSVTTTAAVTVVDDDLCHPAYIPCLPNLAGDALNCGDLARDQKPVQVRTVGVDPYRLDRDGDGRGCTS